MCAYEIAKDTTVADGLKAEELDYDKTCSPSEHAAHARYPIPARLSHATAAVNDICLFYAAGDPGEHAFTRSRAPH